MPRQMVCIFLFMLLLLCPLAVRSETITAAMRAEDMRLNTPVTLDESRISVGELLNKLSQQTGITLTTKSRENASGRKIFLCCDKAPLGDVLDALWSLLSYRPAFWKWERTGKAEAFCYELSPTLAAADFHKQLKGLGQEEFSHHAKAMIGLSAMSAEERKQNVSKISAAMLLRNEDVARELTNDNFTWGGLQTFAQALTDKQQQNILHGGSMRVNLDSLPEEARASFHKAWNLLNARSVLPNGQQVPIPEPSQITFVVDNGLSSMKNAAPSMFIDMGEIGSMSVLGNMLFQFGIDDKIYDMWLLPGDKKDNPIAERICTLPKTPDIALPSSPQNDEELLAAAKQGRNLSAATASPILQTRMKQLSRSLPVTVVGLLPDASNQSSDPGIPYGRSAQTFLKHNLAGRPKIMTKWRGDTLLVTYPTWFLYEEDDVPYSIVQQLHTAAKNGFVPFAVLVEVSGKITLDQWRDLCHSEPLQNMEGAYPLLQFCSRFPLTLKPGGVGLSDEVIQVLRNVPPLDRFPVLFDGKTRALRVQPVTRKGEKTTTFEMQAQYLNAQREWHPLVGFTQVKGQ